MEGGAGEAEQARPELRWRAYGQSRGRKGGGRKEKEAPTGGASVSATHEKKKRRREGGPLRVKAKRAAGLLGRKSERGEVFFFFFSFLNPFQIKPFEFKFK
jgi:hypothetical protein